MLLVRLKDEFLWNSLIYLSLLSLKSMLSSVIGNLRLAETVFLVNAIAFHPIYGTFATGGCDGFVNVWDGINKKRLYQYSKYASSIAALSFSKDGHLLAVASSYTYEGEKPHEPDSIFIQAVNEVEVKPKPKALAAPQ